MSRPASRVTASRFRARTLLLGCGAVAVGCGRRVPAGELPEPPQSALPTQGSRPGPQPSPGAPQQGQPNAGQVPRIMVFAGPAPGTTITLSPSEPAKEPEATVEYPSLRVACDSVEVMVQRHLAVALSRADDVPVDFGFGGPKRTGCELKASGKFERAALDSNGAASPAANPDGSLDGAFKEAGWVYAHYAADGPDGSVVGWRSKESTCVLRWSWDGGDDSDSTYVSSDDWELVAGCVPWEPEDSKRE
jgi:hypothetical protein